MPPKIHVIAMWVKKNMEFGLCIRLPHQFFLIGVAFNLNSYVIVISLSITSDILK